MALLPGSPAIDAGNTSLAPTTDQRGFPRPAGLAADIGAFEFGSVMPTLAHQSAPASNGLNFLGSGNRRPSLPVTVEPQTCRTGFRWPPTKSAATEQFYFMTRAPPAAPAGSIAW